jgi:hypothetical protein
MSTDSQRAAEEAMAYIGQFKDNWDLEDPIDILPKELRPTKKRIITWDPDLLEALAAISGKHPAEKREEIYERLGVLVRARVNKSKSRGSKQNRSAHVIAADIELLREELRDAEVFSETPNELKEDESPSTFRDSNRSQLAPREEFQNAQLVKSDSQDDESFQVDRPLPFSASKRKRGLSVIQEEKVVEDSQVRKRVRIQRGSSIIGELAFSDLLDDSNLGNNPQVTTSTPNLSSLLMTGHIEGDSLFESLAETQSKPRAVDEDPLPTTQVIRTRSMLDYQLEGSDGIEQSARQHSSGVDTPGIEHAQHSEEVTDEDLDEPDDDEPDDSIQNKPRHNSVYKKVIPSSTQTSDDEDEEKIDTQSESESESEDPPQQNSSPPPYPNNDDNHRDTESPSGEGTIGDLEQDAQRVPVPEFTSFSQQAQRVPVQEFTSFSQPGSGGQHSQSKVDQQGQPDDHISHQSIASAQSAHQDMTQQVVQRYSQDADENMRRILNPNLQLLSAPTGNHVADEPAHAQTTRPVSPVNIVPTVKNADRNVEDDEPIPDYATEEERDTAMECLQRLYELRSLSYATQRPSYAAAEHMELVMYRRELARIERRHRAEVAAAVAAEEGSQQSEQGG